MSAAESAVRLAARLLPAHLRDRYREQWMADLRDAESAGIPQRDIAIGSLAFAASIDRPILPGLRTPDAAGVVRRSRLASGLALSVALLALAQFARAYGQGLTGNGVFDFTMFVTAALLGLYCAIALVAAIALVSLTRGVVNAVRAAVWMLVIASLAPIAQGQIDSRWYGAVDNVYETAGKLAYVAALGLVVAAGVFLWRTYRGAPTPRRPLRASAIGGLGILAGTAVAVGNAVAIWGAHTPPVWLDELTASNQWIYDEWMRHKVASLQLVGEIFAASAISGAIVALAVFAAGFSRRMTAGRVTAVAIAAACLLLLAHVGLVLFLQVGSSTVVPTVPTDAVAIVAQWGLIATVLYAVGGVRFERRRHARVVPEGLSARTPT